MPKKKLLTQGQVLDAINHWLLDHGVAPTVEELRQRLQVGSTRTVLRYLAWLEADGLIKRWPGARGIRLLKRNQVEVETTAVPLIGLVPAGSLMLADENLEGVVRLPSDMVKPASSKFFLLRVSGDSMNRAHVGDALIEDGDLVLVRQAACADSRQIVVALIDGQVTIKRLVHGPGYYFLKPESTNPVHKPILLEDGAAIQGIATRIIKRGGFLLDRNEC